MINQFLMEKRCCSRLEKYVSDRVWSEPYAELRTNTRPRILNAKKPVESTVGNTTTVTGYIYTAAAGVLTGTGEQVALPSSSLYYVYSIELNQFRSIKVNALEWVSLEEYCSGSRTDIKVYSDDGIVLWRGGIFMKQDAQASSILIAIDANMLHKCMDTYTTDTLGRLVVTSRADPSAVLFTKYVESDYTADDIIKCIKFDAYSVSQLKAGKSSIPSNSRIMFCNGRVLIGNPANTIKSGDYVECIVDEDIATNAQGEVADFYIDRASAPTYLLTTGDASTGRMLIHIPRDKNRDNLLITYNVCDVYVIPKVITEAATKAGLTDKSAGLYMHIGKREKLIHQLTHNDFSINLSLLDGLAEKAGADYPRNLNGVATSNILDYYVRVIVRCYTKKTNEDLKIIDQFVKDNELDNAKFGAVRDANYCDLLYTESHTDDTIVKFLLNNDADLIEYGMTFWTAAYLEQNSMYAKAMMLRVGPTSPNSNHEGKYRAPIEKRFESGKSYFVANGVNSKDETEAESADLGNGIVSVSNDTDYPSTTATAGQFIPDGTLEFSEYPGKQVTTGSQCANCGLYSACASGGRRIAGKDANNNPVVLNSFTEYLCPEFSARKLSDYINILGYYHTLSLICKRVTTYYVKSLAENKLTKLKIVEGSEPESVYESRKNLITVHVPLALYDLDYTEFYPMVYINGDKLDASMIHVQGYVDYDMPGMIEKHWTYTPSFGDDSLWEEEQRRLLIKIDDDLEVGDYITVEILPKPAGSSATVSSSSSVFDLDETTDDMESDVKQYAFRPIGVAGSTKISLLESELLYLNGKQLVAGIDYTPFSKYRTNNATLQTIIQNVQYLENYDVNDDGHQHLDYTCTSDVTIGSAKGFVVGNWIPWEGISPFWFDNLSILTVGGRVCSNFAFQYSGLDIRGEEHQNGEPFMVRTLVPKSVLDMLNTTESLAARAADDAKYAKLSAYFDNISSARGYRALIPYSHKVYSTYLTAIIEAMLTDTPSQTDAIDQTIFDFEMLEDPVAFKAQFAQFESLKQYDVVYTMSEDDRRFVDVYPIYHNLNIGSNLLKRKIAYLVEMLSPSDEMRHREHVNV